MLIYSFHRRKLTTVKFGVFITIAHTNRVRLYSVVPLTILHGFGQIFQVWLGPRVIDILAYIIVVESSHLIDGVKDVG